MYWVAGLAEEDEVPFPLVYGGLPLAPDRMLANRADEQAQIVGFDVDGLHLPSEQPPLYLHHQTPAIKGIRTIRRHLPWLADIGTSPMFVWRVQGLPSQLIRGFAG